MRYFGPAGRAIWGHEEEEGEEGLLLFYIAKSKNKNSISFSSVVNKFLLVLKPVLVYIVQLYIPSQLALLNQWVQLLTIGLNTGLWG